MAKEADVAELLHSSTDNTRLAIPMTRQLIAARMGDSVEIQKYGFSK